MNKIPCEIIQDLMPSYVDGLTSDVTNRTIEEHIESCEKCGKLLERMRDGSDKIYEPDENDKKEIDFLKKNKKRNLRIVLLTLGAAVFIIAAVIVMRYYVVGETLYGDWVTCTVEVEGNTLTIEGEPVKESGHVVSDVVITEEEGVIRITTKGALPGPFHKGGFSEKYTAKQDIQQVIVNGRVVWYDGRTISAYTACVYSTRHEYVGDMSANGKTATELGITNVLGNFTNELETEQEPYGWIIKPEKDVSEKDKTKKEDYMDSYAYVILAVIGNLDRVTYEYTVEGEKFTRTIDSAMATEYFGRSIKDCGSDMRLLDDLIEMTGLSWN